jgi:hypothetical protein
VGVYRCPVSCLMVTECMEISTVSDNMIIDSGDTPVGEGVSIGGSDGKDMFADAFKAPEKGSVDNSTTPLEEKVVEVPEVEVGGVEKNNDDDIDGALKPAHGDLDTAKMGDDTMKTEVGTKSMADDIGSDDSKSGVGGDATKANEQDSNPDVGKSVGGYGGSPPGSKDDYSNMYDDVWMPMDKNDGDAFGSNADWNSIGSNGLGDFDEPKLGMESNVSVFFGIFVLSLTFNH